MRKAEGEEELYRYDTNSDALTCMLCRKVQCVSEWLKNNEGGSVSERGERPLDPPGLLPHFFTDRPRSSSPLLSYTTPIDYLRSGARCVSCMLAACLYL